MRVKRRRPDGTLGPLEKIFNKEEEVDEIEELKEQVLLLQEFILEKDFEENLGGMR